MGVGWGKFYQHGVEARLYLFQGDGTLSVSVEKVKPSLLDGLFFAVAIWPVTGQGFQNTKWPAVLYYQ